jgi:hypothetical protein
MNGMRKGNQGPPRRRPPSGQRNAATNRQRQSGWTANARRNYERYLALAREATSNGDVIEADNWFQHAEHYFRVMGERAN